MFAAVLGNGRSAAIRNCIRAIIVILCVLTLLYERKTCESTTSKVSTLGGYTLYKSCAKYTFELSTRTKVLQRVDRAQFTFSVYTFRGSSIIPKSLCLIDSHIVKCINVFPNATYKYIYITAASFMYGETCRS